MKRKSIILFRILFLIALLFSNGIIMFSDQDGKNIKIEYSERNNVHNELISDGNSYEDDQIQLSNQLTSTIGQEFRILVAKKYSLYSSPLLYIWQPPELS